MSLIRVVLYAEGSRETSGIPTSGAKDNIGWGRRRAGEVIPDEDQGPGHVLIRRILIERNLRPGSSRMRAQQERYSGARLRGHRILRTLNPEWQK